MRESGPAGGGGPGRGPHGRCGQRPSSFWDRPRERPPRRRLLLLSSGGQRGPCFLAVSSLSPVLACPLNAQSGDCFARRVQREAQTAGILQLSPDPLSVTVTGRESPVPHAHHRPEQWGAVPNLITGPATASGLKED